MSDLTHKIIADLRDELAAYKAEANKVTESMGSEILRLHGELEQQRTRAEGAEQEIRLAYQAIGELDDALVRERSALARSEGDPAPRTPTAEQRLFAARAHLAGVDVATLDKDELTSTHAVTNWWEMRKLLAAAREVLS